MKSKPSILFWAAVASLALHLLTFYSSHLLNFWEKEPERIKVPITVKVVDKSVPIRKGDIKGSFKPPEKKKPEKKTKPKPKPKKPAVKKKSTRISKKTSEKPAPEPEDTAEEDVGASLPGQQEIIGENDNPFGVADGVEDGVVGVYGDRDQSSDATLIANTVAIPEYTDDALDAGFEGLVNVEVFVNKQGRVSDIEISPKVGFGMDERIRRSAEKAQFIPRKNSKGQPLSSWTTIPFRFVIP